MKIGLITNNKSRYSIMNSIIIDGVELLSRPIPLKREKSPYLDVIRINSQNFNSNLNPSNNSVTDLTINKNIDHVPLIREPIQVPNLMHTGAKVFLDHHKLESFCPDGLKSPNLRSVISHSLRYSASCDSVFSNTSNNHEPTDDKNYKKLNDLHSPKKLSKFNSEQANGDILQRVDTKKSNKKEKMKNRKEKLKLFLDADPEIKLGKTVSKRNYIYTEERKIDKETKNLLADIKSNAFKMSNLINIHSPKEKDKRSNSLFPNK